MGFDQAGDPVDSRCFNAFPRYSKMVLLAEFDGSTEEEVREKVKALHADLKEFRHHALFEKMKPKPKLANFGLCDEKL